MASVARMWSCTSVGVARAVEAPQQAALVVVVDQRLGLLVVGRRAASGSSRARRRRAGCSGLPSLVADVLVLRRVELDVVEVAVRALRGGRTGAAARPRRRARRSAARRSAGGRSCSSSSASASACADGAREAVEQEAVVALAPRSCRGSSRSRARRARARRRPCTRLASLPSSVSFVAVLAQQVAGADVGQAEVLAQARGLGALAGPGGAEEDEVELAHEARAALLQEALVVAHHQLRLELLHRVQRHADHDQDRGAAEVEVRPTSG